MNNINAPLKALIKKYNYAVPRYTSFPTAVQFHDNVTQDLYRDQLSQIPLDKPVSLYVHIPFCHQLCHYCGCHTKIVSNDAPIKQYIDVLLKEIKLVSNHLSHKHTVSRIHFGGGSPNYACPDNIKRIIDALSDHFDLSQMQIDMECDPRLLTEENISKLAGIGLSRISLGIQDFNPHVQKAINREQPYSVIKAHMDKIRRLGIQDVNFDLIIGLPEQTLKTVSETLSRVIDLSPERIAVFPYAHVPWMKKHQLLLERFKLPDTEERFAMSALVKNTLEKTGYKAIGIDHFAKPGNSLTQTQKDKTIRRNFQGYTDDPADTILSFGLSSITQLEGAYIQNTTDAPLYKNRILAGELPITRGLALSQEDKIRRALINRLMCHFEINLADFPAIPIPFALAALTHDGLIEMDDKHLKITETGKPFTRVVAARFDPYFTPQQNRHAKAI